ncbi:unnamed protein product [Bursaphelenchus xylophilus]|uniref:Serine/threonine-protein phosphatase n=1 Tax=Bursaphelenchus xylophilus TaxID=6326 RepID=A0A1I7RT11_BURXY|nr:unnamed protein product [Bursaphelenchus xylophilus]CAG9122688.1 unnamed protein product [Bursaphelenchus xylophilus]
MSSSGRKKSKEKEAHGASSKSKSKSKSGSKPEEQKAPKKLVKFPYRKPELPIMSYESAMELIQQCKAIFEAENSLLEIKSPVIIVGDIHGQYDDLERILTLSRDKDSAAFGINRFLFLGDYVDRGPNSYNCINLLLQLKCRHPKQIGMLRGNHETENINGCYGFLQELKTNFPQRNEGINLWRAYNDMFAYLPLAALVRKRVLCMHGGISEDLKSLDDIRRIKRPIVDVMTHQLAGDLLWSDPLSGIKGYQNNAVRGVSVVFGEQAVNETCQRLGLDYIVRAHQIMFNGYALFANRKLITIFSAPKYCLEKNSKAVVLVLNSKNKISFVFVAPVESKTAGEKIFKRDYKALEYEQVEATNDLKDNKKNDELSEPTRGTSSNNPSMGSSETEKSAKNPK